jgi:hypothetical protein
MFKSVPKLCATMIAAGLLVTGHADAAFALNFQWTITNNFGTAISLDSASCLPSGSISAPVSMTNGSTVTFTGTSSAASAVCTVRYHDNPTHVFGCQFQVQTNGTTGFASANAYKGAGGRPSCTKLGEGPIPGGWQGTFEMH